MIWKELHTYYWLVYVHYVIFENTNKYKNIVFYVPSIKENVYVLTQICMLLRICSYTQTYML